MFTPDTGSMSQFSPTRFVIALAGLGVLTACINIPELGDRVPPDLTNAPFPQLIPLDAALTTAQPPAAQSADLEESLARRVAALKAKAQRLQGPVVDSRAETRMETGVSE